MRERNRSGGLRTGLGTNRTSREKNSRSFGTNTKTSGPKRWSAKRTRNKSGIPNSNSKKDGRLREKTWYSGGNRMKMESLIRGKSRTG
jgi:hypothetical protein